MMRNMMKFIVFAATMTLAIRKIMPRLDRRTKRKLRRSFHRMGNLMENTYSNMTAMFH